MFDPDAEGSDQCAVFLVFALNLGGEFLELLQLEAHTLRNISAASYLSPQAQTQAIDELLPSAKACRFVASPSFQFRTLAKVANAVPVPGLVQ